MGKPEKIWNRRFILLFITNLLVLVAFYASIPIIPIYCQEIGITGSRVGIVLTAMSIATILFRPLAGYLLDNFNRYRVYLLFLALFCLSFPAFIAFPLFAALIVIRLYMGAVYSVCGSATMTLAGDVLPTTKITEGISRFAFTVSIGMAVSPYVGLQVQSHIPSFPCCVLRKNLISHKCLPTFARHLAEVRIQNCVGCFLFIRVKLICLVYFHYTKHNSLCQFEDAK